MLNRNILIAVFIILAAAICGYWYFYSADSYRHSDITDLSIEYNVDNELAQAKQKIHNDIIPAKIYVNSPETKEIVLTFDGLPDPTTTDRLLDLLDKYNVKASFFIDGSSAAIDNDSLKKIHERNYTIGNYTYVGLSELDKMPQEEILLQLLKTQKVIKVTTGTAAEIFKAPQTTYTTALLKTAAAADLKAAVKTNVYVKKDTIDTDAAADALIKTIIPGSIISLDVATPVNRVQYKPEKKDERPAFDKQPGLKTGVDNNIVRQNIVDVTERILKSMDKYNIKTTDITNMRLVSELKTAKNNNINIASISIKKLQEKIIFLADTLFFSKAQAQNIDYEYIRQKNAGTLAEPIKMILTTEPSLSFAFAGLTKSDTVYDILNRLKRMNATGTFFVMKNDIDNNPSMIKDIIASGNEVGIGIRSLKNSNFYTVCAEVDYVRSRLESMGVYPSIAMQPWGAVADETREALAAMGLTMVSPYINAVRSDMKGYTAAENVVNELFGKYVYSLGRGWIVYFRLDYYDDDSMAGKVMDLIKRKKIDNIAYNSFYDDPKVNTRNNNSAYTIKSVGQIMSNSAYRYAFSSEADVPEYLHSQYNQMAGQALSFKSYIKERFIGNPAVSIDSNAYGFSLAEMRSFDKTGQIHTNDPVIFFTFDDWGTDAAINPLLYVLRKHNAKANFFVLTHNVMNNPNLLRSIAMDGHDIGSHSDWHKPMTTQDARTNIQKRSVQSREAYMQDLHDSYKKLETVVGDVVINGQPSLTRYFRPPQLTVSRMGLESLYANGYTYVIDGSYSTHDYDQPNLLSMLNDIKTGIYENGKVRKGAILVMHMSDNAEYTARALDLLLTANEQRKDGDPAKFIPARLSDYLVDDYNQSNPKYTKMSVSKDSSYNIGGEKYEQ
ncbi:polysaccharide deacetylase family protein [Pectinatus haikarae]|uniref:polysaccharide deacetylase family protein n=1 Tax=Pectinatus haikarae TaxID=349096 RepID=UPI0018C4BA85|nr:polysaccharide deacetylase family protein [Pectinatus haikarae]